jgi:hypothetical protein
MDFPRGFPANYDYGRTGERTGKYSVLPSGRNTPGMPVRPMRDSGRARVQFFRKTL